MTLKDSSAEIALTVIGRLKGGHPLSAYGGLPPIQGGRIKPLYTYPWHHVARYPATKGALLPTGSIKHSL